MIGVSRQRARQIIDSYDDFPAPVVQLAGRDGWDRAQVADWIARHPNRTPGRPPKQERKENE